MSSNGVRLGSNVLLDGVDDPIVAGADDRDGIGGEIGNIYLLPIWSEGPTGSVPTVIVLST